MRCPISGCPYDEGDQCAMPTCPGSRLAHHNTHTVSTGAPLGWSRGARGFLPFVSAPLTLKTNLTDTKRDASGDSSEGFATAASDRVCFHTLTATAERMRDHGG